MADSLKRVPYSMSPTTSLSGVELGEDQVRCSQDVCAHHIFERRAAEAPEAVAVTCDNESLTYGELNGRANELAQHLRSIGVGPEVRIGLCMERSTLAVIALMGILKAGAVYVPMDPDYPAERLAFIVGDAAVKVLLTRQRLAREVSDLGVPLIYLDAGRECAGGGNNRNPPHRNMPANLAYIIYTSGSTGRPKGVMISHESLLGHCREILNSYSLCSSDRVLQFYSLAFDASLEQILPTLLAGAGLVLRGAEVWPPAEFHLWLSRFGITVMDLPPAYWQQVARVWARSPRLFRNHGLRLVVVGGEQVSPEGLRLWNRAPTNSVRLLNSYGPTEATMVVTHFDMRSQSFEGATAGKIPIGKPLAGRKIYILDSDQRPVPAGALGELFVGGAGLARGYLSQPQLTAERFIPNPFAEVPGERLYRTGDVARCLPDGNVELRGRTDQQVKVRGFRIELGEIESTLAMNPAVREAAVVAGEERNGDKRLLAYVVAAEGSRADGNELRSFLKAKLPAHMLPSSFIIVNEMPRTVSGKIDRLALRDIGRAKLASEEGFVGPRTADEEVLASIWREVLAAEHVGIRDDFFERGGSSLTGAALLAEVAKTFGRTLPLSTLLHARTIEKLAELLRGELQTAGGPTLRPIRTQGSRPPVFFVHPAPGTLGYRGLLDYLHTQQPAYELQAYGPAGNRLCFGDVGELAAYYVREIRGLQRTGPYYLGGFCFGGEVAFEVASQLYAQGEAVAFLFMFDTVGPINPTPTQRLRFHAGKLRRLRPGERWPYLLSRVKVFVERVGLTIITAVRPLGLDSARLSADSSSPLEADGFVLMKTDFMTRVYPGEITLLRSISQGTSHAGELNGWHGVAAKGVTLHTVPGTHLDMFSKENIGVLAEKFRACLEKAQGEADLVTEIDARIPLQRFI